MVEPALRFRSFGIALTQEEKDLLGRIHAALNRLTRRREAHLPISPKALEEILREVLLYRVVATARGAIVNWNAGNILCSFLAARALFETFAFLWDYRRAVTIARQTGTLEDFERLTRKRLTATRNPQWVEMHPEWKATNIGTLIEKLSKAYPGVGKAYDQMSYRCHPNTEGMFYMFADIDPDAETVRFSNRNEDAGWAFRLIFSVTGLVVEVEEILNWLEEIMPQIGDELQKKRFNQLVAEADLQEKRFEEFAREEEKALLGQSEAQFKLGTIYAAGTVLPKNVVVAYMWFSLSAAQSNEKATKRRDKIALSMTAAQIDEAQSLAAQWKPLTSQEIAEIDNYWRDYWDERISAIV